MREGFFNEKDDIIAKLSAALEKKYGEKSSSLDSLKADIKHIVEVAQEAEKERNTALSYR